jgi:hypothetical protein
MSSTETLSSTQCAVGRQQTCPSGRCREGATLLGIVGADGVLGYIAPKMTIDAAFVIQAKRGINPQTRFRFAEPCVEHQCEQWSGNCCGLIHHVLASPAAVRATQDPASLPECVIRSSCRWFAQVGKRTCAICPEIVHTPD